ncbi:MAG TPA: DUF6541 family protein [Pseudonocardiaceae bacterium]|nr:DUF6541 family protein [Pseudonocardiaceae bacterium]
MGSVLLVTSYLVLLWGPGLLLAAALRAPVRVALAAAPAVTYGLIGASTPVLAELGVAWSLWSAGAVLGIALVAAAIVTLGVRLAASRRDAGEAAPGAGPRDEPPVRAPWWWAGFGVLGAAVLAVLVLRAGAGRLDAINQYWDAVWHSNYTQWIADTGVASPLRAGQMVNGDDGGAVFYPSAMHAHAALVKDLLGESVVRVLNVALLVLCALLAPIGAACLAWAASARDGLAAAFAALAAGLFSSLPFDQVWRPAWPFGLSLALSATVVALLTSPRLAAWPRMPLAVLATAGAVSVQPAAIVCIGLPVLCWLLARLRRPAGLLRAIGTLAVAGALTALVLAPQLVAAARLGGALTARTYPTPFSVLNAAGQVLSFRMGFPGQPGQWVLAGLVVLGVLVALVTRRGVWLVPVFAVYAVLAVHTLAGLWAPLRMLTAPFWNDYWRLAAATALIGSALVGLGLAGAARASVRAGLPGRWLPAVAVVLAAGLLVATSGGYVGRNAGHMRIAYTEGYVGAGHLEAMRALRGLVAPGERVLNDPVDGSPWIYATTGVRPVFLSIEIYDPGPRERLLLTRFDELDGDEQVRRVVRELGLRYLYVGDRAIYPWISIPPGFDDLADMRSLTLVMRTPTASVYRIDAG